MLNAIAIDDEPLALDVLRAYCAQSDLVRLERGFTRLNEARDYLSQHPVDLLFLDVQMPGATGVEFYRSLPSAPALIFASAHPQYAIDGFELSAVDFLLKPFSYERFLTAVQKVPEPQRAPANEEIAYLHVHSAYSLVKVACSEIVYIESFADYLDIHLSNGTKVTTRLPMKSVLEKLPAAQFARVHRSFVVGLAHIVRVRNKTVFLPQREIPVGQTFEQDFLARYRSGN